MPRLTIASLSLLATLTACSTSTTRAAATPANSVSTTRYELLPAFILGGEGRHSASHSSTTMRGALSITGDRAELVLDHTRSVSYVHCSDDMASGRVHTMQACAPRDAKPHSATSKQVLRGTARTQNGALVVSVVGEQDPRDLRIEPAAISLTCRESFLGLACAIDKTNVFNFGVIAPRTLAFLTPGTKRFAITPVDVNDVGRVTGSLALDGGAIALTLALDGGKPTTLPGTARWLPHGISLAAETEPTRNLNGQCTIDGDNLRCEVTGDRSILGKPEHIYSQMILVPARAAVPAQAPMPHAPVQASK